MLRVEVIKTQSDSVVVYRVVIEQLTVTVDNILCQELKLLEVFQLHQIARVSRVEMVVLWSVVIDL